MMDDDIQDACMLEVDNDYEEKSNDRNNAVKLEANPFLQLLGGDNQKLKPTVDSTQSSPTDHSHHASLNGPDENTAENAPEGCSGSALFNANCDDGKTTPSKHEKFSVVKSDNGEIHSVPEDEGTKALPAKSGLLMHKSIPDGKKTKINPVFSNVLMGAMRKQKAHFPMVYIGAPIISDMRAYAKQKSEVNSNSANVDTKRDATQSTKAVPSASLSRPEKSDDSEKEIVETILSTSAEHISDLQKVLESLQEVQPTCTSSMYTKLLSELSSTTVNDFDPPSMVQVFPNVDKLPKVESINYINNKSKVLQNKWARVPKLQYSFKPAVATTSVTSSTVQSPKSETKTVQVKTQKPVTTPKITSNQVISVPLTFPSKPILHLTPSQTGITMSAKIAKKLPSSNALKVLANKVKAASPVILPPVMQMPPNPIEKLASASAKQQHFSVKVLNPANSSVTQLNNVKIRVGKVHAISKSSSSSNNSTSVAGKPTTEKVNESSQMPTPGSIGTKRKAEEEKSTVPKKLHIAGSDVKINDIKNVDEKTVNEKTVVKPVYKGKPGALVRFEDGVEMWIDKLRDITFVDDEPVKSWALKPDTEVAVKFTDGLFYDAVVVRSFAGTNHTKASALPATGKAKTPHVRVDTDEVAKPSSTKAPLQKEVKDKARPPEKPQAVVKLKQEIVMSKVPQVQVEKLKVKVPPVVAKIENNADVVKDKPPASDARAPPSDKQWTKCTNCFLVFGKTANHRLHQKTVCGGVGYVFKGGHLPPNQDIVVDESEIPPLVKNAKEWRKSGDSKLFLGRDGKRWFKRGTRFLHRWQTEGGRRKWYNGIVRSVLSGSNCKDAKCQFEVEYTDDDHDNGPYSIALYEDFPHDIRIVLR